LLEQAPRVKYVLVRAGKIVAKQDDRFSYEFFGTRPPNASSTLLLAPASALPPEFELLYEVTMRTQQLRSGRQQDVPYAKLYKIVRRTTSVNNVSE
jgi:hypothetical protein